LKPKTKSNWKKILITAVFVTLGLVAAIGYESYAEHQQSLYPTSSSTAALQPSNFTMSSSQGCLMNETGGTYDYFAITIRNSYSENVRYLNASIVVSYIDLINDQKASHLYPPLSKPITKVVEGPNETVTWAFPINFPMWGTYWEPQYAGTRIFGASFTLIIFYQQNDTPPQEVSFPRTFWAIDTHPNC